MEHFDLRNMPDMPALMIAGPCELHDEDLEVVRHQVIAHYGEIWTQIHDELVSELGVLLGTQDPPYVLPGSGTVCLDAAVGNLFQEGDRVVVANTGFFGIRLMEIARAHRLEVVEVPVEVGAPIDPARIADEARRASGVLTVHVETATGVRHPVERIAQAAHDSGAIYMVDAIASVGGEVVDVEGMRIDCLVTGSQKGLEAPPGVGILALGPGGRARVESLPSPPSFYMDLKRWDYYRREWGSWHPHPVTMPTNVFLGLASSVRRIWEAGLQTWIERRADLAKRCREGLINLGLEPIPGAGVEANLVVACWADDPVALIGHLIMNERIMISGGLEPCAGKSIRVGLMGRTATEEMVDRLIAGAAAALGK